MERYIKGEPTEEVTIKVGQGEDDDVPVVNVKVKMEDDYDFDVTQLENEELVSASLQIKVEGVDDYYDIPKTVSYSENVCVMVKSGTKNSTSMGNVYDDGKSRKKCLVAHQQSPAAQQEFKTSNRICEYKGSNMRPSKYNNEDERRAADAERKRKARALLTREQREANNARQAERQRQVRAKLVEVQKNKHAERRRQSRANLTPEQRELNNARQAERKRQSLKKLTPEQRVLINANKAERERFRRECETAEETIRRLEQNATAKRRRIANEAQTLAVIMTEVLVNENAVIEHYCGPMNIICQYCNSLNFQFEKPKDNKFTQCCQKGKVALQSQDYPILLKNLMTHNHLDSKQFLDNIRAINSSFAFASMGANIGPVPGYEPHCFRIHGQIYHRTGILYPPEKKIRKFAQLYILDTASATNENQDCHERLMYSINELLYEINDYAKSYRMLHEIEEEANAEALQNGANVPEILMGIKQDPRPRVNEVAVIFENNDGDPPFDRDILVHLRTEEAGGRANKTKRISILDNNLDAMTYPIFFPRAEQGWSTDLHLIGGKSRHGLTMMHYYSYKLSVRNEFSPILSGGRLTQQFVVDAYVKMEANRLNYIRTHTPEVKANNSNGLSDHLSNIAESEGVAPLPVVPTSFEDSPRKIKKQRYQDAMAILTKFGKPDLFVTITCNPKWLEITENLLPCQKVEHRPDLVARVFNIKLKNLLDDVKKGLFGKLTAIVHVIEFQERGLPQAHILIILDADSKLHTETDIDRIVSAEIPDRDKFPILHGIVVQNMIHDPCGTANPNSPCMENGKCSKHFPKDFTNSTIGNLDGYPKYMRRVSSAQLINGKPIDNSWVVPYNRYLLLKYNCHINVEVCTSIKSVKYLFKYVYKGHDCANVEIKVNAFNHEVRTKFVDSRYVGPVESCWRIFSMPIHKQSPAVMRLAVHLPNEQNMCFSANDKPENTKSTLMAWFELNSKDANARNYYYMEIPEHYVYKQEKWDTRKTRGDKIIGRMYSVSIKDQECHFLRLLLLHVKGANSFAYLKTYKGIVYTTFRDSAKAHGLLLDDSIWKTTLEEAVVFKRPRQLRALFAYMCVFVLPIDLLKLWEEFKKFMIEDYCGHLHNREGQCKSCEICTLKDINDALQMHGKSFEKIGLPAEILYTIDQVIDHDYEFKIGTQSRESLNMEQKLAFDTIIAAINTNNSDSKCFFIDGPGGSGKTYLYNTLINYIRGLGEVVLAAASTDISASLLLGGQSIHSIYGLPLNVNETSVSNIKREMDAAKVIKSAKLLIIDDCTLVSNHELNTIEKLLRELMRYRDTEGNIVEAPFGGKVILLGGDFRQILTIIPHSIRPAIVQSSFKFSHSWKLFRHLRLINNIRSDDSVFSEWLLKLGDGVLTNDYGLDRDIIEIPPEMLCTDCVVTAVFGNKIEISMMKSMSKRVILCQKNDDVEKLNKKALGILDGEYKTYLSYDSVDDDDSEDNRNNFAVEFLNSLCPSGMPRHILKLKVGCIIMLLRNLNTRRGLCHGTRLLVISLQTHLIEAEVLTGLAEGERVLISRIDLRPSDTGLPFKLNRRQFPVKPAFAMTINKSQGQSFEKVGIYLPEPASGHGQLYAAFSRARRRWDVKVQIVNTPMQGKLVKDSDKVFTRNVVYREIFD